MKTAIGNLGMALVVVVVSGVVAGRAPAALIAPDSVIASSQLSGADKRLAVDCINGNGLIAGMHTNASYADTTPGPGAGQDIYWLSASKIAQWIDFAFTTGKSLDGMRVWNYSERTDLSRGVRQTDIEFYLGGSLVTTLTAQTFTQAPGGPYTGGSPTYAGEFYNFGQTILADHVKFTNMTNWIGYGTGGGDLIGLSEIRFNQVLNEDIPEPATMALLGLGVGCVGRYVRRRR